MMISKSKQKKKRGLKQVAILDVEEITSPSNKIAIRLMKNWVSKLISKENNKRSSRNKSYMKNNSQSSKVNKYKKYQLS